MCLYLCLRSPVPVEDVAPAVVTCTLCETYSWNQPQILPIDNAVTHGGGLDVKSCLTLATAWTVARQAPLSMGFSRQEYWSGLNLKKS